MFKSALWLTAALIVVISTPTYAEPMDAVLKRCAQSKGCGFSEGDNGDVSGCSIKSKGGTGHCFYCNASTKDCFQVGRVRGGKWHQVPGSVLADLEAAPRRWTWW